MTDKYRKYIPKNNFHLSTETMSCEYQKFEVVQTRSAFLKGQSQIWTMHIDDGRLLRLLTPLWYRESYVFLLSLYELIGLNTC